jgi:hypothetical protein
LTNINREAASPTGDDTNLHNARASAVGAKSRVVAGIARAIATSAMAAH